MVPYLEVLALLAARGHAVTVLTESGAAPWIRPNYPLLHLELAPDDLLARVEAALRGVRPLVLDPKNGVTGFALVLRALTLPFYNETLALAARAVATGRPGLVLCDFMFEACADAAAAAGVPHALTMSSLPPGCERGSKTEGGGRTGGGG